VKPLKINLKIKKEVISKSQYMKYYKKDTVVEFCKACNNYMKNHSCPDFDFLTEDYLEPYDKMLILLTEIDSKEIRDNIEYFKGVVYESKEAKRYGHDGDFDSQFINFLSVYIFEKTKNFMSKKILKYEDQVKGALGLFPGSCSLCSVCEKENNKPCVYPDKMRYSLEALGFMVSDFYDEVFNQEIIWSQGELPSKFTSCSAILFVRDTHIPEGIFEYDEIIEL
jgi:predicted metal-binding protein